MVNAVFIHKVGVAEAAPADLVVALLKTSKIAELRSLDDKVTVLFPVEPLFTDESHAAPTEASPTHEVAPTSRPSQHPKRQRVRVCIAICDGKIATVMRSSDQPDEVKNMSERGMGGIPDVLEAWWDGLSR